MALATDELDAISSKLPKLILNWASWIDRRVEQFEPIEALKVRRYCSVDFRLPKTEAIPIGGLDQVLMPFAFLRRTTLNNFSLRDDQGGGLPLLIRQDNVHVAVAALSGVAKRALPAGVPPDIASAIPNIVTLPPTDALQIVRNLQVPGGADVEYWNQFAALASDFALNYLAVTLIPNSWVGQRRLIKYQYDSLLANQAMRSRVGWWRALGRWLGVRPVRWQLGVGELGSTRSYHAEVIAPPAMVIGHAELRQTYEATDVYDVLDRDEADHSRPHLHRVNLPRGVRGAVVADLWMNPDVTTRTAFSVSWAVLVTLLDGLVAHSMRSLPAADPVIAILVAVPGAFAAALVSPSEHGLVKVMARGMRERIALAAALSFAAAAILSVKMPIALVVFAWKWLAIASVANTLVLFWGLRVSRRFGDTVPRRLAGFFFTAAWHWLSPGSV